MNNVNLAYNSKAVRKLGHSKIDFLNPFSLGHALRQLLTCDINGLVAKERPDLFKK